LSPAYDLNPVPVQFRPRILSTLIDEQNRDASLELALSVAGYLRSVHLKHGRRLMKSAVPSHTGGKKLRL
jgi:hypothetical protein